MAHLSKDYKKNLNKKVPEELGQYDFLDTDIIEKNEDNYSSLIGLFLIRFSELEHNLNITIADLFFDDAHYFGYFMIENLTIINKIDVFEKKAILGLSLKGKEDEINSLKNLASKLRKVNTFRNRIVHANWMTLKKNREVRTKIFVDKDDGLVKFKNTKISENDIEEKISQIEAINEELGAFFEK